MAPRTGLLTIALVVACRDKPAPQPPSNVAAGPLLPPIGSAAPDPAFEQDREDFVADTAAFLHETRAQVLYQIAHNTGMKDEWNEWEKTGPMTDARIKQFYKQTKNYIVDLGGWHLWDLDKRASDLELVAEAKKRGIKNVLDFGGGPGFNALLFARAGFDVTLADLDSVTLGFGTYRAEHHGVTMKLWKTDVEPMPPDKKYDLILCLDVLEHLPPAELHSAVDKLIRLKHANTIVSIHAPFGRTAQHPMHLDETDDTKNQIWRLRNLQPAD